MENELVKRPAYSGVCVFVRENLISLFLIICGLTIGLVVIAKNYSCFGMDTFSYYDISKTFFNEFGKVSTIRQYVIDSDYNCSFPYLYPLCIFIVDSITGLGLYSGVAFNILIMLLTMVVLCIISMRYTGKLFCSAVVGFLLFTSYDYLDGVFMGASLPLAFFLFAICAFIISDLFLNQEFSIKKLLVLGFVAGLNVVNRFDEISFLVYLIPAVFVSVPKGRRILSCSIYSLSAIIPVLPWSIYSLSHFGTLFASDNNGTILLVDALPPNRVILPGQFVADIFNSPLLWVKAVFNCFTESLKLLFTDYSLVFAVLIAWLLLVIHKKNTVSTKSRKRIIQLSFFILLYAVLKLLMYVFIKYILDRYFVIISFLCLFTIVIILYKRDMQFEKKKLNILIVIALLVCNSYYQLFVIAGLSDKGVLIDDLYWVEEVDDAIQSAGNDNEAVITIGENGFAYGAMTGRKTFLQPIRTSYQSIDYIIENNTEIVWMILGKNQNEYDNYIENYYYAEFDNCYLLKIR